MLPIALSQQEAKEIDKWLMSPTGGAFTLPQLMELAGSTVSQVISKYYHDKHRIFIACGPGNNGGDGIVAARQLSNWSHKVTIYQPPQENQSEFFQLLMKQAACCGAEIISDISVVNFKNYDLLVDALFGFGFRGSLKDPYDKCVAEMIQSGIPIVSVDCPSGWTADASTDLKPEMLISLTAPKECAKHFDGKYHILGGRFIPKILPDEFKILEKITKLYKEDEMFILISQ